MKNLITWILKGLMWVTVGLIGLWVMFWALDRLDCHTETATVISIQRLDTAIVRVETADGNLWDFETDLQDNIDIGDIINVTFKEFENDIREDDMIVDYEIVVE